MPDENNVNAGSETSGDQAADTTVQTDTTATDTGVDTSQDTSADQSAGNAADVQHGSAADQIQPGAVCICKDGRPGTIHLIGGETICLANQG